MKKVLAIALILGFVWAGNAVADEHIYGFCFVDQIKVYEAFPCRIPEVCGVESIRACSVGLDFLTRNRQQWDLVVTAYGNALNLALLKMWNEDLRVPCRLTYSLDFDGDELEIEAEIDWVFFGGQLPDDVEDEI